MTKIADASVRLGVGRRAPSLPLPPPWHFTTSYSEMP